LLLARNVHPKYVQELLGHATVKITLDTYSHVIPGMGNHTAHALEDVFFWSGSNCRQVGLQGVPVLRCPTTFNLQIYR
jgi:hypothetical protein